MRENLKLILVAVLIFVILQVTGFIKIEAFNRKVAAPVQRSFREVTPCCQCWPCRCPEPCKCTCPPKAPKDPCPNGK